MQLTVKGSLWMLAAAVLALLVTILAVLLWAPAARADTEPVLKLYAGANGVWYDGPNGFPSDYEAVLAPRISLTPHLSLVGSAAYGFIHQYTRGGGGARVTITDVNDPNFSIGLGGEYQVSNDHSLRPEEWTSTVNIAWKPWAGKLIIGAQGAYGFDSDKAWATVAARYPLFGAFYQEVNR